MFAKVLYPLPFSEEIPSLSATVDIPLISPIISSLDAFLLKSSKLIYFPLGIINA